MITIKDFSLKTDFSIRMLRYLEELKLLVPNRDENNYRIYSHEQIQSARRIKKLQDLGVQLKEIEILQNGNIKVQLETLEQALVREQEIAEIKSDSIPALKNLIEYMRNNKCDFFQYFDIEKPHPKKLRTIGGEEKFHRTAYNIPILKNIYEDHLSTAAGITLIATDLMKFSEWFSYCNYVPEVYSILRESSFAFGKNINEKFILGYEVSWKKFLPEIGLKKIEDFSKEDARQLMGQHDIVIRTIFKYADTGVEAEIVIPYTPVYTMAQLSNKT